MPSFTSGVGYIMPDDEELDEREFQRRVGVASEPGQMRYRGLNVRIRHSEKTEEYGLEPGELKGRPKGPPRPEVHDYLPSQDEERPPLSPTRLQSLAVHRARQGLSYQAGPGLIMKEGKPDFRETRGILLYKAETDIDQGSRADEVLNSSRRLMMKNTAPGLQSVELQGSTEETLDIDSPFNLLPYILLLPFFFIVALTTIQGTTVGWVLLSVIFLAILGSFFHHIGRYLMNRRKPEGEARVGKGQKIDPISVKLQQMKEIVNRKMDERYPESSPWFKSPAPPATAVTQPECGERPQHQTQEPLARKSEDRSTNDEIKERRNQFAGGLVKLFEGVLFFSLAYLLPVAWFSYLLFACSLLFFLSGIRSIFFPDNNWPHKPREGRKQTTH